MIDVTKINITQEDVSRACQSGFSDGALRVDVPGVSGSDYQKLVQEHNRLADAFVKIQSLRSSAQSPTYEDFTKRVESVLDDLGEVSPF